VLSGQCPEFAAQQRNLEGEPEDEENSEGQMGLWWFQSSSSVGLEAEMDALCVAWGYVMLQEGCKEVYDLVSGTLGAVGLSSRQYGQGKDCRATQEKVLGSNTVFSHLHCVTWSK